MKKLILFIIILALFSCNNEKSENETITDKTPSVGNSSQSFLSFKSETGAIQAILESNKEVIKKLDPVEFKLKLMDKKGNKIKKAKIVMDLNMPGMAMPKNEIKLTEAESGIYNGIALFTMKGEWRLQTTINTGKQKEIIFFDLAVI
jgi:nitrogen fixation protein FixH